MNTPRLVDRNFILLVVAHFITSLGWTSMLLLPVYLEHVGANRTQIGSVMAAAAISGLLLRPLVGWSLDHLGRRSTLAVGTVFSAIGMGLVGLVDSVGAMAYVQRLVFGVGQGAIFTGYFVWLTDLVPPSRRTEGIALFGISGLAPLAVNAFAGQLGVVGPELRWFLPLLGGVVLCSLLALLAVPETLQRQRAAAAAVDQHAVREQGAGASGALGTLRMLVRPPMLAVWLASMIFSALVSVFFSFVTVAAARRHIAAPASVWLAYAAGAIGVRLLGGRLPDRIGTSNLVTPALSLYGAGVLVAARMRSRVELFVAGLVGGLGHGYGFPILTSQVMSRADPARRGAAMAAFTALWELSRLASTPAFGAFADAHDDASMFALAATVAAAGLLLWAALESWQHRRAME